MDPAELEGQLKPGKAGRRASWIRGGGGEEEVRSEKGN